MDQHNREQIRDQSVSYRRGLVMGLTMAEAGILIIFVLLMLIGLNQWQIDKLEKAQVGSQLVKNERLRSLENAESSLTQLKHAVGLSPNASVEEVQTLVRAVNELASTPAGQSALKETRMAVAQMQKIRNAIISTGGQMELAEQAERQSYRIANQDGQLQRYEQLLSAAGIGKGERPCWVKPDGTIEYLYDVVLENSGIRMREHLYPEREHERSLLPMPNVGPGEILSPAEFIRRTYPLYERSQQMNCRFFVVIFDATGPTEKAIYKNLLRTVEGHFYKYMDNGIPQF